MPDLMNLYLWVRYSKNSGASVSIAVYIDDEVVPRATFVPQNQGDWNMFDWTSAIDLGSISAGSHSVKFYTDGQQFGVADLDKFILSDSFITPDC